MDEPLLIVILLFLFFTLQHSLTVSDLFKGWVIRGFGENFYQAYYKLLFTIINIVIVVILVSCLKQLPNSKLFIFSVSATVWMRILQCLGVWILFQAGRGIDLLNFIGVRQMIQYTKEQKRVDKEILIRNGIYGRVRHPIYFGCILILWGEPHLLNNRNGIALVVLSNLYFYFGSILEERRMIRQFGEEYQMYQKAVPRLLPFRWRKVHKSS
jgi:protein-S-isoprenylcysteine O-methyltransferase Ste14